MAIGMFCILYTFHGKSSANVYTMQKEEVSSRLGWRHGISVFQSVKIQATTCPVHGKATENAL